MQMQWIASDSCIPIIIILVYYVVGINALVEFAGEQSKTGEVIIDSKDPSCVDLVY